MVTVEGNQFQFQFQWREGQEKKGDEVLPGRFLLLKHFLSVETRKDGYGSTLKNLSGPNCLLPITF